MAFPTLMVELHEVLFRYAVNFFFHGAPLFPSERCYVDDGFENDPDRDVFFQPVELGCLEFKNPSEMFAHIEDAYRRAIPFARDFTYGNSILGLTGYRMDVVRPARHPADPMVWISGIVAYPMRLKVAS